MKDQVRLHNEVILVGRIIGRQKNIRCNNKKAIRVKLAIPNDDDYEMNSNIAYVYIYDDNEIYNQLRINQAIAINGHVECNWGQRIIAHVIRLIEEQKRV